MLSALPERDARLVRRTLSWVLHQLAQRLAPVAADDPAALAFAGLSPDGPIPAGEPVTADEDAALDQACGLQAVGYSTGYLVRLRG